MSDETESSADGKVLSAYSDAAIDLLPKVRGDERALENWHMMNKCFISVCTFLRECHSLLSLAKFDGVAIF